MGLGADVRLALQDQLPLGLVLADLPTFDDPRGRLTEIYREGFLDVPQPVQWNIVRSAGNVLRGVHGHYEHADYLVVVEGSMLVGLHDLRPGVPSHGWRGFVELHGARRQVLQLPIGVAHGFYFAAPATYLYGLSSPWSLEHHLGCRWDDPDLGLDWPCVDPLLSEKDEHAGTLSDLRAALAARLSVQG